MKYYKILFTLCLLLIWPNAKSEVNRITAQEEYNVILFTTNYDNNDSGKYKAALIIQTNDGYNISPYDDKGQLLVTTAWKNGINITQLKFGNIRNLEGNKDILYIPIELMLTDPLKDGNLVFSLTFPICKKTCKYVNIEFPVDIKTFDKDYESYKFIESLSLVSEENIWIILALALLGGFVLNFMPCVLPVISLKLYSIIQSCAKNKLAARKNFLASGAGIIATFFIIGIITASIKTAGHYAGLGLHFQEPYFVATIIIILVIFASLISRDVYIYIPKSLSNKLTILSINPNIVGSFFSGVLATILATPCTAPYIGTAMSFAMTNDTTQILLIFFLMGVGMAIPFLLLAMSYKLQTMLPKPGKWMIKFKKLLEILLYLTIIWLLFIFAKMLDEQSAILLFLLCILLKFIIVTNTGILSRKLGKIIAIIIMVGVAYYLPFKYLKNQIVREQEIDEVWQVFSLENINYAIKNQRIALVDITADWCVTCKYNKFMVLDTKYMMNFLQKNNIVTIRGDYTTANQEINKFLQTHERYGIPLNVVYSNQCAEGMVLDPILTIDKVVAAIRKCSSEKIKY